LEPHYENGEELRPQKSAGFQQTKEFTFQEKISQKIGKPFWLNKEFIRM